MVAGMGFAMVDIEAEIDGFLLEASQMRRKKNDEERKTGKIK